MRGMLHGERPTAAGPRYSAKAVRNDPPPIQERLPLLVGGGGEQVTLKLVAQYADANNVGGGLDDRASARRRSCSSTARPSGATRPRSSGRPASAPSIIRDSREEADRVQKAMFERNGHADLWTDQPVGTPEDVAERLLPYLEIGYRHLIAGLPVAPRRGIDDPLRDRGPAAPRARLTPAARGLGVASPELLARDILRAVARGLGAVATGRHVAPAAAGRPRGVVEDPAAGVVVADPDAVRMTAGQLGHQRLGQAGQGVVDRDRRHGDGRR